LSVRRRLSGVFGRCLLCGALAAVFFAVVLLAVVFSLLPQGGFLGRLARAVFLAAFLVVLRRSLLTVSSRGRLLRGLRRWSSSPVTSWFLQSWPSSFRASLVAACHLRVFLPL
jgi:hypothetical protein